MRVTADWRLRWRRGWDYSARSASPLRGRLRALRRVKARCGWPRQPSDNKARLAEPYGVIPPRRDARSRATLNRPVASVDKSWRRGWDYSARSASPLRGRLRALTRLKARCGWPRQPSDSKARLAEPYGVIPPRRDARSRATLNRPVASVDKSWRRGWDYSAQGASPLRGRLRALTRLKARCEWPRQPSDNKARLAEPYGVIPP